MDKILWIILAEQLINLSFPFKFKIIGYADDIALVAMHKVLQISIANLQLMCNDIFNSSEILSETDMGFKHPNFKNIV